MVFRLLLSVFAIGLLSSCTSPGDQTTLSPTPDPSLQSPIPSATDSLAPATEALIEATADDPDVGTVTPTFVLEPTSIPATSTSEIVSTSTQSPSSTSAPILDIPSDAIIIDSRSIAKFELIPDEYLEIARNTTMVFVDRSVGFNIDQALNCLEATSWANAPSYCRRDYTDDDWNWKTFTSNDLNNNQVPSLILFDPDPVKYDRRNWTFQLQSDDWQGVVQDFIEVQVPVYKDTKSVLSYQFNYFHVDHGSTIDGEVREDGAYIPGFFDAEPDNAKRWDISDLEALEAQYPDKIFIYWTTSLARAVGSEDGERFNQSMREYTIRNGKVLFDVAEILSTSPSGSACYDSRDGVCYCNKNQCEDYSISGQSCEWDDGLNTSAICQNYTTETLGGHLGSVSGGGLRIAKAFWVLMARISGWDGITE